MTMRTRAKYFLILTHFIYFNKDISRIINEYVMINLRNGFLSIWEETFAQQWPLLGLWCVMFAEIKTRTWEP